jgi:hypothetical protein
VWRVLRKRLHLKAYKLSIVQHLTVNLYCVNPYNYRLALHIRQPSDEQNTSSHILSPFDSTLWKTLAIVMVTVMVALTTTWYLGAERGETDYGIKTSCFLVLGVFCQQSEYSFVVSSWIIYSVDYRIDEC